jgi:DNA polymerase-3 subunit epsilon
MPEEEAMGSDIQQPPRAPRRLRAKAPQTPAQPETTTVALPDDTAPAAAGELLYRARALLESRGEPLTPDELARYIFGSNALSPGMLAPWVRLVDQLLRPDPAFSHHGDGRWGLTAWEVAQRGLSEVEFAILDVETTGLAPGRHRLIEVGAVIVCGGEVGSFYSRLVNPERRIPQFITQFTGISESMARRAAKAPVVLRELRDFIGERPTVGHNIGFDLGFLSYEAERCGLATGFPLEGIDTIALARRYLPGMRRAKLDRVAAALHIPVHDRHRALPDARVTAQVFVHLLALARAEGCETLEDLYRVLFGIAPARTSMPRPRPTGTIYLNPAWRQQFPTQPGVYLMKDDTGEVIYVGKAKCLRDRLASYYSQPLGYSRKLDGLLQSVRAIETRVLGSELEALLVESALIKELQPRYNVQLRNYEHYPFIKVDVQHPYPRFYATRDVAADGARYFGPFRSGRMVEATIELIQRVFPIRTCIKGLPPQAKPSEPCLRYHLKRCPAPCHGELPDEAQRAYRAAVEEACAFLGGERDDLIERLKREMFAAAARQDFERAARLRDALRGADQVLLGQRLVTGAVEANNLLIVYPSSEPGKIELYLIRHGRLAGQRRVAPDAEGLREATRTLLAVAATLGTPPAKVGKAEVDQINIIARWIHHHSDDDERAFFRLPSDLTDAAESEHFVARVLEGVQAATSARAEVSVEMERLASADSVAPDVLPPG